MEFTQNLPPIRGGYVHKNNFFHVGGSKILVEMCWHHHARTVRIFCYLGNSEGEIGMPAIQVVSNG